MFANFHYQAFRAHRANLLFILWTCSFCLHLKTKKKNILRILKKNSQIFKNLIFFIKLKTFKTHFFIFIIHKPSQWSRDVQQKIWARSVQPFWRLFIFFSLFSFVNLSLFFIYVDIKLVPNHALRFTTRLGRCNVPSERNKIYFLFVINLSHGTYI